MFDCKHKKVAEPTAPAAIPMKLTCPSCGATGWWSCDEARFVADGSGDVNVVREGESSREDDVHPMSARIDALDRSDDE